MGFVFRFNKLFVFTAGVLLCATWCDISRDNVLDPKNPDSFRPRKVTVEAFVNTDNPFPYNQYVLSALDSLLKLYSDRLVVAEYHRHTNQDTSKYHLNENELLYQHYLDAVNSTLKGVPDVFINGIRQRVQGASSKQSALFRLQEAILSEITANSYFTLEISYTLEAGRITPEVTLARLGSEDAEDILLKAVLISRIEEAYHKRVVRGIVKSSVIPKLAHGEFEMVSLPELAVDESVPNRLIVYVTDRNERSIYQSKWVVLE